MRARRISWRALGLRKPERLTKTLVATVAILAMAFELIKDAVFPGLEADDSSEAAKSKFGDLTGDWLLLLTLLPVFWRESMLEELLDRGFLMNWLEWLFRGTVVATVLAVVLQAAIFGFRHSYDFSERSVTVGIIGLAMGIGYVGFGRNLWPLIFAHCALNTMSLLDRV
jgi:hypothetical protein